MTIDQSHPAERATASRPKVIRLLERTDGRATEHTGRYLVYFSPDRHNGPDYEGGTLITTAVKAHAQRFADARAALEYWKQSPTCPCHAIREDGRPNRPLTAYTVTVEDS